MPPFGLVKLAFRALLLTPCVASAWPSASGELLDLAARIEYGFYAEDAPVV
jgi:hypothetical protein